MTGPTAPRPYPTTMPPPAGGIAKAYFTPLMAPCPVATRLPQPNKTEDTINGFLRIEAAGGPILPDSVFFDIGIILHSYAPNAQESLAEQIMALAIGWGNNASGSWVTHPSSGIPYFVSYSRCTSVGVRQQDPLVNLTRFVGKVTWRMQGQYIGP
jgi:hypothetical protein